MVERGVVEECLMDDEIGSREGNSTGRNLTVKEVSSLSMRKEL